MKEFIVKDFYENYGTIGEYDTIREAKKGMREWEKETDGECDLVLYRYNECTKELIEL